MGTLVWFRAAFGVLLAEIKFFFHAVCALELKKLETQIEQKYSSF